MARQAGMKGLQLWCKQVTEGYRDVQVTNMTTSFRDGLAFCAIIHAFRPDLIPFDSLQKGDVARNNELAFRVAEEELDIPALLDVQDMVDLPVPDKLSIATYLISYYNHFKEMQPQKRMRMDTEGNSPQSVPKLTSGNRVPTRKDEHVLRPTQPAGAGNKRPSSPPKVTKPVPVLPPANKRHSVVPPPPTGGGEGLPVPKKPSPKVPSRPMSSIISQYEAKSTPPPPTVTKSPLTSTSSTPPVVSPTRTGGVGVVTRRSKFAVSKPASTNEKPVAMETEEPRKLPSQALVPPAKPPTRRSLKRGGVAGGGDSIDTCEVCHEKVFLMQRVHVEGHLFHRGCFKCNKCRSILQSKVYEYENETDRFYCRQHFREVTRQKSIKRTMEARGIKAFDENDIPKKQKTECVSNDKKREGTVPVATPTSPEATADKQIKDSLPSLLSSLAAQKKNQPGGANASGGIPPIRPPASRGPPPFKSSVSSPSIVKPFAPLQPSPPLTNRARPPAPPTKRPTDHTPPPPRPAVPPSVSTTNKPPPVSSKFWVGHDPAGNRSPPVNGVRKTGVHKNGESSSSNIKETVSPTRPAVGERWKKKEREEAVQQENKPEKTRPFPPPTQSSNPPPTQSDINRATVLMHYEFGPSHFAKNEGAQKVLEEHYEFQPRDHRDSEPSPYEVPQSNKQQPPKPTREKRKGVTKDEPHPPRNSETWRKPYALTPVASETNEYAIIGPGKTKVPARTPPTRPAPFAAHQKKSLISPYAVSGVNEDSPIRDNLKRDRQRKIDEYQSQLEEVETKLTQLEQEGVRLETQIRSQGNDDDGDDQLIEEWFNLVNQRNEVVKNEAELVYMIRDLELIEQHHILELEIRTRMSKDDSLKTELEKVEEATMIEELVELVMKRDKLLWEFDELREEETV